eukprot:c12930_g2_i2.p1 GENE.c12930_g2_i2~~c12930_g2_i2.p1  ORF type:complete len:114 (-),score=31.53 c12930_g2_i2:134-475(-)
MNFETKHITQVVVKASGETVLCDFELRALVGSQSKNEAAALFVGVLKAVVLLPTGDRVFASGSVGSHTVKDSDLHLTDKDTDTTRTSSLASRSRLSVAQYDGFSVSCDNRVCA